MRAEKKIQTSVWIRPSDRKILADCNISIGRAVQIIVLLLKYKRSEIERMIEELK